MDVDNIFLKVLSNWFQNTINSILHSSCTVGAYDWDSYRPLITLSWAIPLINTINHYGYWEKLPLLLICVSPVFVTELLQIFDRGSRTERNERQKSASLSTTIHYSRRRLYSCEAAFISRISRNAKNPLLILLLLNENYSISIKTCFFFFCYRLEGKQANSSIHRLSIPVQGHRDQLEPTLQCELKAVE